MSQPFDSILDAARQINLPDAIEQAAQQQQSVFPLLDWWLVHRHTLDKQASDAFLAAATAWLKAMLFAHPLHRSDTFVPVLFGTGGHRGEFGSGLTLAHVHAIINGWVEMVTDWSDAKRLEYCGSPSLLGIKARGVLIGHDNRLFNRELAAYTAALLRQHQFQVCYGGRMASPQISLLTPRMGFCSAWNFTPSHNPYRYGGIKYNPVDGGLADSHLTPPLAERANHWLKASAADWSSFEVLDDLIEHTLANLPVHNLHNLYLDYLDLHPLFNLTQLRDKISALPADQKLFCVADPGWGAAIPAYQALQKRLGKDVLELIHTTDDAFFDGQPTEPEASLLLEAQSLVRSNSAHYRLVIRNDPDGDRGLIGDDDTAYAMNRFAPLVYKWLNEKGFLGALITTFPTSHMGPDWAKQHHLPVHLTPTGFKHFNAVLKNHTGLLAYEESNGLSVQGHTLDKDGIAVLLLGMRMVLDYRKPLSQLMDSFQQELGAPYYWVQQSLALERVTPSQIKKGLAQWQPWEDKLVLSGKTLQVTKEINEDGRKWLFSDDSWVMVRPSGTEPLLRIYAETRDTYEQSNALCTQVKTLVLTALNHWKSLES